MADWRKQTLQMTGGLACVYFLIMCLMIMQLHLQERRLSFLSEDQEHEKIHFSLKSDYCYKGPEIPKVLRKVRNLTITKGNLQSKTPDGCAISGNPADVQMEKLWSTLDVSYPLALSVSGWLDVVQVYSWIQKPLKVIIVPHSHQDPGWLNTFEYYFETYTHKTLDLMVDQLTKNPTWRFVWSEVCWLDKWWNKTTPAQKDNFKRLLRNGQVEIVSGGWVMADEAVVHYSAMLNQFIDGHQWLLSHLGITPNVSWAIDPFGHSPTMAYLQGRGGIRAMVIQRIHFAIKRKFARQKALEFKWRQLWDGGSSTDITTHVLPFSSYAITHSCGPNSHVCCQFDFYQKKCYQGKKKIPVQDVNDDNIKERAWLLWEQFQKKSELFQENVLLVPHGDDFRYSNLKEWEQQFHNLEKLMGYINNNSEMNTQVKFGTLSDYFEELEKSRTKSFPTFAGDFFPYSDRSYQYWTGFYTTRPHLKYIARRIQGLLRSVEILYAVTLAKTSRAAGQVAELLKLLPDLEVGRQELALFQHHDAITGTSRKSVTEHYNQRLQHAFNKVNALFEKVMLFHLELSFGVMQNHTISTSNDWMNIMKDKSRKKIVNLSQKKHFIVYNSLGHNRREIITLTVDRPNVKVTKNSALVVLPHQISPIWQKSTFAVDCYELMFEVNLSSLSFTMVTVEEERETILNTAVVIFTEPGKISQNMILPGIRIQNGSSPYFSISNGFLTAYFYTCNGRLQYVMQNSTGLLWRSEVKVMTYTSGKAWSTVFKDKGGAYTFVPDGPAETLSEPVEALFLIDGPLFSRVVTVQSTVVQTVTLYKTSGNMGKGVYIENKVNIETLDNTELMMRVESNIKGPKAEMCVDLNGFQMHRKTTYTKRHIQGNFNPMTTMASVENEAGKLTLLTTSARGVASLSAGWLEVGLDRRMKQDDWRGLGEGVTDNVPTKSSFMLVFEAKTSNMISEVCYPSALTNWLSNELENPSIVAETSSISLSQEMSDPTVSLTKTGLPCDIHLVSLRVMAPKIRNNSETGKGPGIRYTAEILLILHKNQFDCNVKIGNNMCLKNSSVLRLEDVFIDCAIVKAWETTLFGSSIRLELQRPYIVDIEPMEIKTFRVYCS